MKKLGYYAKDSQNNLFQFEWGANNEFYILNSDGNLEMTDPNKYQILEIGLFHDESDKINDVSYCDDCVVNTEKVDLETCNTCPFNKYKNGN